MVCDMFRETGVILIASLMAVAGVVALGGVAPARADEWTREAAGGMDGTYRRIRVEVKGRGKPQVRTRSGYYASEPETPKSMLSPADSE